MISAGTAGSVIAARLSENPAFSVLVIEAGPSNQNILAAEVPFLGSTLSPNSAVTWNYTTAPQIGLNNRTIPYPRGYVLGGSSTINFEVWTRGSRDDYNRFANVTCDSGWSWDEMVHYMKKSEHLVPPTDNRSVVGEVDPSVHGKKGPVQVSLGGFVSGVDRRVIDTTRELDCEFPYNVDMNSGYTLGLGWTQNSVSSKGFRSSSATAYLAPAMERDNLDVLIQTRVTKLVAVSQENGVPTFGQVEVAQTATGPRLLFNATKEVVLSGGSINTPQLLQLSGVGDSALLAPLNITTILNLGDVGKNLSDHPFLANHWLVNSTSTLEKVARNATLAADLLAQWNATGTGLFSDPGANQIGWKRLPSNSSIFQQYPDPSAGPTSAHYELLPVNGFVSFVESTPATGFFSTIVTNVASPLSRGSVTLASSDPFDNPIIDPALLGSPFDIYVMVEAIKSAKRFVEAPAWKGYIIQALGALNSTIDEDLAEYARNSTTTVFHPVGTARMTSYSNQDGVVNPDLLVKGASGLRIVDASVLPYIPAAHTQACVYALAERAADLIKAAWS
ncbi:aryl-alcohol oxidase-like protein [Suillus discolor]|uniref:Aryl-alcohol oxidase-like protein n=1 Tax=Suillus discolor TaxID=1912936 RepID=A0A9P7F6J7_9AGAM|nr:aryl-alcohol oxidase-like protein [Suillus discolor]KAG2107386.1 aryl-alcohol oxidase-like protein [Suillus discolor]